jgi:hypothetical protein
MVDYGNGVKSAKDGTFMHFINVVSSTFIAQALKFTKENRASVEAWDDDDEADKVPQDSAGGHRRTREKILCKLRGQREQELEGTWDGYRTV